MFYCCVFLVVGFFLVFLSLVLVVFAVMLCVFLGLGVVVWLSVCVGLFVFWWFFVLVFGFVFLWCLVFGVVWILFGVVVGCGGFWGFLWCC